MKLLYFAWLRTRIGVAEEELVPPPSVRDVEGLLDWLAARGANYAGALANRAAIRVAVNQDFVGFDHSLRAGDEVAIFPPMTGG